MSTGVLRRSVLALHCRSSTQVHGPERALLELVGPLAEQEVRTRALVLYRRPDDGPERHPWLAVAETAGLPVTQVPDPGPLSLGVVRRLARRIHASGAGVLHTHDYRTNILGGLAARRSDRSLPWVATVHLHTTTSTRLRLYRALDLFLLRLADRVITVSRDQRRLLLRRGVDRRRIVLVPNVIDADAYRERADDPWRTRQRLGLDADAPVVTLVGRLSAQKGVDDFLAAARILSRLRPETRFLIVGRGPGREALEAQARVLGLEAAVCFLGYRRDTPSVLAASDVVVLPSRAEGMPLVLLEALALGRPVVATPVGGVPELIEHDETGLLVPPDAPAELAEGVRALLSDAAHARRLAAAGEQRVRTYCAPQRAARRIALVYRSVLAERG